MEINDLHRVKHTVLLQVIRDILIENNLTTRDDVRKRVIDKLENTNLSKEEIADITEGI
jgi:hypothetical protein